MKAVLSTLLPPSPSTPHPRVSLAPSIPSCLSTVKSSSFPRAWALWSLFRWCLPSSSSPNPLLSPSLRGPSPHDSRYRGTSSVEEQRAARWWPRPLRGLGFWTRDGLPFPLPRWSSGHGHCWRHGSGRGGTGWTHRTCCIQVQILNETASLPLPGDRHVEPMEDTGREAHPSSPPLSSSAPVTVLCDLQPPLPWDLSPSPKSCVLG